MLLWKYYPESVCNHWISWTSETDRDTKQKILLFTCHFCVRNIIFSNTPYYPKLIFTKESHRTFTLCKNTIQQSTSSTLCTFSTLELTCSTSSCLQVVYKLFTMPQYCTSEPYSISMEEFEVERTVGPASHNWKQREKKKKKKRVSGVKHDCGCC